MIETAAVSSSAARDPALDPIARAEVLLDAAEPDRHAGGSERQRADHERDRRDGIEAAPELGRRAIASFGSAFGGSPAAIRRTSSKKKLSIAGDCTGTSAGMRLSTIQRSTTSPNSSPAEPERQAPERRTAARRTRRSGRAWSAGGRSGLRSSGARAASRDRRRRRRAGRSAGWWSCQEARSSARRTEARRPPSVRRRHMVSGVKLIACSRTSARSSSAAGSGPCPRDSRPRRPLRRW